MTWVTSEEQTANELTALKASVRAERDARIGAVAWRRDRYRDQSAAGITTTDTADTYTAILTYIQALRDVPAQSGFPSSVIWPTLSV